jgi:hypothetical protein
MADLFAFIGVGGDALTAGDDPQRIVSQGPL